MKVEERMKNFGYKVGEKFIEMLEEMRLAIDVEKTGKYIDIKLNEEFNVFINTGPLQQISYTLEKHRLDKGDSDFYTHIDKKEYKRGDTSWYKSVSVYMDGSTTEWYPLEKTPYRTPIFNPYESLNPKYLSVSTVPNVYITEKWLSKEDQVRIICVNTSLKKNNVTFTNYKTNIEYKYYDDGRQVVLHFCTDEEGGFYYNKIEEYAIDGGVTITPLTEEEGEFWRISNKYDFKDD